MYNHEYSYPVLIAKGVATSEHVADLGPLKVGIFDRKTNHVATASGNGKEFYIAYGSPHTRDELTKFYKGMKNSKKSEFFLGKDIVRFEKALPQAPENEEWTLGYGGGEDDSTLQFECNRNYEFKVKLFGEPAFTRFNKTLERIVSYKTPCCPDGCDFSCESQKLDVKEHTIKLAETIMNDVELQEMRLKVTPIFSDFEATNVNSYFYQLKVVDSGDADALFAVERVYGKGSIIRVKYDNGVSTYEIGPLTSAPAAFTPSQKIALSLCGGTCPSGYNVAPAQDTYIISRPLAGTENLTDAANKQLYADAIAAAYFGKTFNATSDVNASTETITATAHGFTEGQAVKFRIATGLLLGGVNTTTTYYVIAAGLTNNTFRVSTQRGGSALDLTAAVGTTTVYPADVVFLNDGGGSVANIKVAAPTGLTVTALLADNVDKIASEPAYCVPGANSSTSWVQSDAGYTITRTIKIVVPTLDCAENAATTLAEVQDSLSGTPSVSNVQDVTSAENDPCVKVFTATQTSKFMKDKCSSPDVAEYDIVPTFKGIVWNEVITSGSYDATIKAGLRFTAPFYSVKFGNCSFDPKEYWDNSPIRMEVSVWDQSGNNCLFGSNPEPRKVKQPKYQRLYGEYVVREYIKGSQYFKFMNWEDEERIREVIDTTYLSTVNRNKYYVAYYLKFASFKQNEGSDKKQEWFEPIIFVEEDDKVTQAAIENHFQAITAKWGVGLENRISI
jgi:hypothetical protein